MLTRHPTMACPSVDRTGRRRRPELQENGHAVAGLWHRTSDAQRASCVAIDHSRSMTGKPLADAIAARPSFVARSPRATGSRSSRSGERHSRRRGFSLGDDRHRTALPDSKSTRSGGRPCTTTSSSRRTCSPPKLNRAACSSWSSRTAAKSQQGERSRRRSTLQRCARHRLPDRDREPSFKRRSSRSPRTGGGYSGAKRPLSQAAYGARTGTRRTWRLSYLTAARPGDSFDACAASGRVDARRWRLAPPPRAGRRVGGAPSSSFTVGVPMLIAPWSASASCSRVVSSSARRARAAPQARPPRR